ncbi:MAG TPA: type II toxin-antitoxin system VapC family toxin [Candidatus Acidoferrum sp.]|nr:type II toxin-antitoxin system VapC family toxin [Candidatus Acidoferrum sp.]
MNYLLDTNACIALMNGAPVAVRSRFDKAIRAESRVYIPSVVAFELWYGIAKSARIEINTQRLEALLSSSVFALPFDNEDARVAGSIRADLQAVGRPIGGYDYLIAGQALARQLTLVTANVSEFSRVKGLSWQDWAKP